MIWIIMCFVSWVLFIVESLCSIEKRSFYRSSQLLFVALVVTGGGILTICNTPTSIEKTLLGQKQVSDGIVSKWEQHATGFRSAIIYPMDNAVYYELKTNSGIVFRIDFDTAEKMMGLTIPQKSKEK